MENAIINWLISLISDGAGGNLAGALQGGGLLGNIGSSLVGGILLPLIVSFFKKQ